MSATSRSRLRRVTVVGLLIVIAALTVACDEENLITVENTTSTQLRVFVKVPGGGISSVFPSPGESSSVVVPEQGTFYAFATVDTDWIATITAKRDALNAQIHDPDSLHSLSGDQVSEIL